MLTKLTQKLINQNDFTNCLSIDYLLSKEF